MAGLIAFGKLDQWRQRNGGKVRLRFADHLLPLCFVSLWRCMTSARLSQLFAHPLLWQGCSVSLSFLARWAKTLTSAFVNLISGTESAVTVFSKVIAYRRLTGHNQDTAWSLSMATWSLSRTRSASKRR
ncbi:hypothetical protein M378DRAFT_173318 [Amanita muscaria Koide BX008]|uniref:Uncharacterized protein n=1 Tax=Amanita muscaria (strain Koide BX008) TaxID=946122 RepID=A0A0C2W3W1_AMAMK|nr:hypothetical protein M378DRAFT_173318 [Amanita muscaria Koide BX008]